MKKLSFLLFILISVGGHSYADMPEIACHSVCPNTPAEYKINQGLSSGGECTIVGKYRIYYRTLGKGSPTIIFSSGTGFPADEWFNSHIAPALAKKVKVVAYDRVFTFNSCPNPNDYMPLTAQDVVDQLHQFLQKTQIKPPYILVGHSMGGLYMLLYAREFPAEVAGLLLMDASSAAGPTPFPKQSKEVLKHLGNPQNPTPDNPLYNEMIGQLPSYLQIKNAPPLKRTIPLMVMYSTKHCLPISWTKEEMCMSPAQENQYQKNQIEIANMSDKHQMIRIEGDHMVFFSKKKSKMVVDAVNTICSHAVRANIEVTISAENVDRTDEVISIYQAVSQYHANLAITLQAYLRRSDDDFKELIKIPGRIRIVKGAFETPANLSIPRGMELDQKYLSYIDQLLAQNHLCSIATHDKNIQDQAKQIIQKYKTPADKYEFESLYGIRNDQLFKLQEEGYSTKLYFVYGKEWYLYLCNRIAEYPFNIFQALADIFGET